MKGLLHFLPVLGLFWGFAGENCLAAKPVYPLKADTNGRDSVGQLQPTPLMGDSPRSSSEYPPPDPPPPPAKPGFVQQNYASPQSPQTSVSVSYAAPQVAGNANILAIGWNDTFASINSVADAAGNTYQAAVPVFSANGMSQAIYYASNIRPGNNTVTVTFNQPAAFVDLRITEYSGLSTSGPFEGGSSGAGIGTNADSGPVSISSTNDLLFGAGMTATVFTSAGDGFNLRVITSPDGDIVEDSVASVSGLYRALASLNSGAWLMQVTAFKPAAPAGPPQLNAFLTSTNTLLITWPSGPVSFTLQRSLQLGTPTWSNVTNSVSVVGGQNQVLVPVSGPQQYFRLKNS